MIGEFTDVISKVVRELSSFLAIAITPITVYGRHEFNYEPTLGSVLEYPKIQYFPSVPSQL